MVRYRSVLHKDSLRKYRQALEWEEKDEKFSQVKHYGFILKSLERSRLLFFFNCLDI